MNMPTPELTTAQLDALIANPSQLLDPETSSLHATLADLRSASISAAEHHHRNAAVTAARTPSRTPRTAWVLAATTAIIACAVTPLAMHRHAPPAPTPAVAIAAALEQPAPAVSDEALYAEVQADLSASVPAPMLPLAATTTTSSSTH